MTETYASMLRSRREANTNSEQKQSNKTMAIHGRHSMRLLHAPSKPKCWLQRVQRRALRIGSRQPAPQLGNKKETTHCCLRKNVFQLSRVFHAVRCSAAPGGCPLVYDRRCTNCRFSLRLLATNSLQKRSCIPIVENFLPGDRSRNRMF